MKKLLYFTVGFLTVFVLCLMMYGCAGLQVKKPTGCAVMLSSHFVDMCEKGEWFREIDEHCTMMGGMVARYKVLIETYVSSDNKDCIRITGDVEFGEAGQSIPVDRTFCD